jgi:glyoxylase-like metal-dependent hydrolase (beta-lactamase superfamily II)
MLEFTGSNHLPIIYSDKEACRTSWNKLKNAGAEVIYPAHGKPFKIKELSC